MPKLSSQIRLTSSSKLDSLSPAPAVWLEEMDKGSVFTMVSLVSLQASTPFSSTWVNSSLESPVSVASSLSSSSSSISLHGHVLLIFHTSLALCSSSPRSDKTVRSIDGELFNFILNTRNVLILRRTLKLKNGSATRSLSIRLLLFL